MSTAFDDIRLPEDIEQGAVVGPSFQTSVSTLSSGSEQRNADWLQERLTADISYGVMQKEDPSDRENSFIRILNFYRARRGRWRAFRFKDWADFDAVDEPLLPTPGGYQLVRVYDEYTRKITRPVPGTVVLFGQDGQPLDPAQYVVGDLGLITTAAQAVSAAFEFDIPMRFDSDVMGVSLEHARAGSIPSIKLIQVRE